MEIWKDIEGYEGLYQVSNKGNVKTLGRLKIDGRRIKERLLSFDYTNRHGYVRVGLSKDGKQKKLLVHRLVAEAFIPNSNNLPVVNHINENKKDNRVENLEWMTQKENINHGTGIKRRVENVGVPVFGINIKNGLILEFPSSREAGRHGFICDNICKCVRGLQGYHKGFRWYKK